MPAEFSTRFVFKLLKKQMWPTHKNELWVHVFSSILHLNNMDQPSMKRQMALDFTDRDKLKRKLSVGNL